MNPKKGIQLPVQLQLAPAVFLKGKEQGAKAVKGNETSQNPIPLTRWIGFFILRVVFKREALSPTCPGVFPKRERTGC
jgi:hypothetical protein